MNKMLITQALDERDLLVKKINDKILNASFADTMKKNNTEVMNGRIKKAEFAKKAKSSLQQIKDLIDRYQMIEAAIVESNASTFIETSYGKYTVAAAIAMRARIIESQECGEEKDFIGNLANKLENEYNIRIKLAEQKNRQLELTAENMRMSILGKENKNKEEKPLEVVEAYIKENTTELVDPINIKDEIESLRQQNDTLLKELNTAIKVSNATTFIEV